MKIVILGCGALGSRIAYDLALPDREFILLDNDTVQSQNMGTSLYWEDSIGRPKAAVLAALLWHKAGCSPVIMNQQFTTKSKHPWHNDDLVIDCFDNANSRNLTKSVSRNVLHAGVAPDSGAVEWDETWQKMTPSKGEPVCTNQLGIPLICLTAAVASVAAIDFLQTQTKHNYIIAGREVYRLGPRR